MTDWHESARASLHDMYLNWAKRSLVHAKYFKERLGFDPEASSWYQTYLRDAMDCVRKATALE